MLYFADRRSFASGACHYAESLTKEAEGTPRIFVPVQVEHLPPLLAVVDTGGVWFVCDPEIAEELSLGVARIRPTESLTIRGHTFQGSLHRVSLVLKAEEGESLTLEVTAFVPHLQHREAWHLPSFLGLNGCLERLRFAVDPGTNTFYFGPLSEEC
jgi:hypothetical protein